MTDSQTSLMSTLAFVCGSVALLGPVAAVSPPATAAAAVTGVVALAVLRLPDLRFRGNGLLYVPFAPVLGGALVASIAVGPATLLIAGVPPTDYERMAAAAIAGCGGAVGVATLLAGARRGLTAERVRAARSGVGRVAGAWLLVGTVSYTAAATGIGGGTTAAALEALIEFESGDPNRVAAAVFTLGAFVPLLMAVVIGAWGRVAASPLGPVPLHDTVDPDPDASAGGESRENADTGPWQLGRLLSGSILLFVGLGLGRPVVIQLLEAAGAPGMPAVRRFNESLIAAASRPGVFRGVLGALALLLSAYVVAVGVRWVRRRIDRGGAVIGPTSATVGIAALVGGAVHLTEPVYRPVVATRLVSAPVGFGLRESLLASLPSVVIGAVLATVAVGFALLTTWLWAGRAVGAEAGGQLAYRNLVFVAITGTVLSAAVYGAPPTLVFVAIVAGLLAWDFLEYGYGLAVEVGSSAVQPPELAHAAASIGVGAILVVGTRGAYEISGSFGPPAAVSYLAVPVLVVSAALLLLYLTD